MPCHDPDMRQSLGYLIGYTARSLTRLFNQRLQDAGIDLTVEQWRVLKLLLHKDKRNQQELANELLLEKPGVTRMIDRLEAKGYVQREADPNDRRSKLVALTEKSRTLESRLTAVMQETLSLASGALPEETLHQYKHTCQLLINNIQNAQHP